LIAADNPNPLIDGINSVKPGTKLRSTVCDAEVMIIRCGEGTIECGGVPMTDVKPETLGEISADHANGMLMGKRYVDAAATFELLCAKPGKGSLSVNGTPMIIKEAKPLPASD
jgi:hypothetical protein